MELHFLPIGIQGLVMVWDEFVFHRSRNLPKWERWGHPLDTLTLLVLILFVRWASPTDAAKIFFISWSVFSCLFVTKDEWVHTRFCSGGEHWLHALLFSLHPLSCFSLWKLWQGLETHAYGTLWGVICFSVTLFLFYQVGYWNVIRKRD
jgi:hypothetical protein